jgi:putative endonuclease
MPQHLETGSKGEQIAVAHLQSLGFQVLEQNWRYSHWEIDIIAQLGRKIHFVEVKTRTGLSFGHPEEYVTRKKVNYLKKAAEEYLFRHLPNQQFIQIDIIAILLTKGKEPSIRLIEDIF